MTDQDLRDMQLSDCMEEVCQCECHDDEYADLGMRYEHGAVWTVDDDGHNYVRQGIFPFLKLPGEIRERIYGYAFLQDGNRRDMPKQYHRGTIHTALLGTCRQVWLEAGHLPFTLNTINFSSAVYGLDFLGFSLVPRRRELVTSVHVEFYYPEFSTTSWQLLIKRLAKMPITHFALTIKGGYTKEAFLGHKCFANCFAAAMKGIKTFDVILGSGLIGKKAKEEIQEQMRETMIKGYKRPKQIKSKKAKRNATSENGEKKPVKKAKQAVKMVRTMSQVRSVLGIAMNSPPVQPIPKLQTKLILSPKRAQPRSKFQQPEREELEASRNRTKQTLLSGYDQLKQYATSMDFDAAPVKIRLEDARKAAEAVDEVKFSRLARSISKTLEERFDSIVVARNKVSNTWSLQGLASASAEPSQQPVRPLVTPTSSADSVC